MGVIFLFIALLLLWCCPQLVVAFIANIGNAVKYLFKDMYSYIEHKENRRLKTGEIIGFVGLFGKGKTLTAVHKVCSIYRAYNGLRVFCPRRKKWVTQKIRIVSNVHLKHVPYKKLHSLEQVVNSTDYIRAYDDRFNTLTCTLVLIDEAGSELNSREFKKNINPLVLNSILTCRHWNISIFYTAQRFGNLLKRIPCVSSNRCVLSVNCF